MARVYGKELREMFILESGIRIRPKDMVLTHGHLGIDMMANGFKARSKAKVRISFQMKIRTMVLILKGNRQELVFILGTVTVYTREIL